MTGFFGNIEHLTVENNYFRKVLFTGKHMQLVVMTLQGGEEIGNEKHDEIDQFFRVEEGEARFVLDNGGAEHVAREDEVVIVPAGTWHNVVNVSQTEPLKLYTVYTPPEHPDGTIHKTKEEADAAEHEH